MRRSTALRLAAPSVLAGLAATACGTGASDDRVNAGPSSLDAFADRVIPELRRRSRFRTHCTRRTQRDHLGLPRSSRRA
ncbi:hypothetical protein ABT270_05210 [Streptomyces sp900105245]|uniref:hypothetical protein n=1 Tax=Streptomyces sp. 900105245 TaxID=3154379 RepID=UPI003329BC0F